MKTQKNRRQWPRELIKPPEVGIIYLQYKERPNSDFKKKPDVLFVNVLNMSKNGLLLESSRKIKDLSLLDMRIWYSHKRVWVSIKGKVKWTALCPSKPGRYFGGVRFHKKTLHNDAAISDSGMQKKLTKPADLEFLLHTTFFRAIPKDAICPLLNSLTFKHLKK